MKASLSELLSQLPHPATEKWPDGVPFEEAFAHGTMTLEAFAPRGIDRQTPHDQDEIYIVARGTAGFEVEGQTMSVAAGDALFVKAGDDHRFTDMSDDFTTWVVLWGPKGGEAPAPIPDMAAKDA